MKYHLDTIPVWDAMKLEGECFLCALERKTELQEADRFLGASVMEPDVRIRVNRQGFCRAHHRMLYGMSNRLGHALMLESHTAETREALRSALADMKKAARQAASSPLGKLSRSGAQAVQALREGADRLSDMAQGCILCGAIRENMARYLATFFSLYQRDSEFRGAFKRSKGVCLPHLADLARMAPDQLGAKELPDFIDLLESLTNANMDRIQEDISWFIKKFDYRYTDQPWKNSQDAVPRTVNKLRGWCVGDEPNPKE